MSGCPEQEDLFEYALDGISPQMHEQVKKHLGMCRGCQDQIIEYALVSEGLALITPQLEAPSSLEAGVFARIKEDKGTRAPVNLMAGWPAFWMRLGPVFAVLALGMTLMAFTALQKLDSLQAGKPVLTAQSGIDDEKIHELLMSSQVKTINMPSVDGKSCTGTITCAKDSRYVMVSVHKMKSCPLGRVYMVWGHDNKSGKVSKLASIEPAGLGAQSFLIEMDHVMGERDSFSVTLEPEDSTSPSGPLYLASSRL